MLETEVKFTLTPAAWASMDAPDAVMDGGGARGLGEQEDVDVFFDTAACDLLRHGLTLRVRRRGDAYQINLKDVTAQIVGHAQQREEVTFVPEGDAPLDPAAWPAALWAALWDALPRAGVKPKRLLPLLMLRQTRRRWHIGQAVDADEDSSTAWLAWGEWSLDKVEVYPPPVPDGLQLPAAPVAQFYELEIELLDPTQAAMLESLAARVARLPGVKPVYTSKPARGLAAWVGHLHGAATLQPTMEMSEACRLIVHQQLLAMMLNEQGAREGKNPEFVHDLRVAIRRARAALRLFGPFLRPKALRPHLRGLKRLGRALGAVRDLDVALENLAEFRRSQPKEVRRGLKELRQLIEAQRAQAQAELVAWLDGEEQRAVMAELLRFCQTPGAGRRAPAADAPPSAQVRHMLPSLILRSFEAVRAYEVVMAQSPLPPVETFHALRIQGKYLRYGLEFARPLLGEPGASLVAQLKELQEHLGQLNDAHVEEGRLAAWAAHLPDNPALTARQEAVAARMVELLQTLPPRLAQFSSAHNRERLGAALARV
jgi:CHAD domain-containing protein